MIPSLRSEKKDTTSSAYTLALSIVFPTRGCACTGCFVGVAGGPKGQKGQGGRSRPHSRDFCSVLFIS